MTKKKAAKKKVVKKKAGRPPFEITPAVLRKTEELAGRGLTLEQIARVLGIGYTTLNEKRKKFPEFLQAIKDGQAKGVEKVSNALFENALDGNTTAQIFYLKNRAPDMWKDQQNIDVKKKITYEQLPSQSDEYLAYVAAGGSPDSFDAQAGKEVGSGVRKCH